MLEPSARFCSRGPRLVSGERSCLAELRRLGEGAGGRTRTCSAPKRVTFWAWCVYLFRHAGKGRPCRTFRPTVSAVKARHARALHQRAIRDWCPRQELNLEPHG